MIDKLLQDEFIMLYGGWLFTILVVFIELALPAGILISGTEVLLLLTGLIAGTQWLQVNLLFAIIPISLSAFTGALISYTHGAKLGPDLYRKKDSLFFKKRYVRRAQRFVEKFGYQASCYAYFLPIIKTFQPMVKGAKVKDNYNQFFMLSGLGSLVYVCSLIGIGYLIGKLFPSLLNSIHYLVAAVAGLILIAPIISLIKASVSIMDDKYSIEE